MKIIFFGTSEFAVPILEALNNSDNFDIGLVVVEPSKPAGRKKELLLSPVHSLCREEDLDLFPPKTLKDSEVQKIIKDVKADIFIVVSYGKIIPSQVFNLPKHKTINVHPSLLPKYRGPSPIQSTLLSGDRETGVTLIQIDEEVDRGPIVSQEKINIKDNDTFLDLEDKLSQLGAEMILRDLPKYVSGGMGLIKQNHKEATFTEKIKKEDGEIDWNNSAQDIYNKWRAFIRWPGVYTVINNTRFNLKKVRIAKNIRGKVKGEMFSEDKRLFRGCADGVIEIEEIQPEGKSAMDATSFINGYKNFLLGS